MQKKLSRSGSGWALFMPKTLLELLKVDPENDLIDIQVENDIVKLKKSEKIEKDTKANINKKKSKKIDKK